MVAAEARGRNPGLRPLRQLWGRRAASPTHFALPAAAADEGCGINRTVVGFVGAHFSGVWQGQSSRRTSTSKGGDGRYRYGCSARSRPPATTKCSTTAAEPHGTRLIGTATAWAYHAATPPYRCGRLPSRARKGGPFVAQAACLGWTCDITPALLATIRDASTYWLRSECHLAESARKPSGRRLLGAPSALGQPPPDASRRRRARPT
jgi:hypothetical protein